MDHPTVSTTERHARRWRIAAWALFAAWVGCAVLVMNRVRGGFVTNYGADLTQPAWLYILVRDLPGARWVPMLTRVFGRLPETAALTILLGSTVTEISQYYWPAGLFSGRFDLYDIVAFAVGIGACYAADRFLGARQHTSEPAS